MFRSIARPLRQRGIIIRTISAQSALIRQRCLPPASTTWNTTTMKQTSHQNRLQQYSYSTTAPRLAATVSITYVEADGTEKEVQAELGKNLLDVAHENNIELEGACGGELACSTCHLIFDEEIYDTLPEKDDEEDDMLDLAFEVTETSRLGCQVLVAENFDGMKVKIPDDGF